jgi:hypothetical protein
MKMIQKYLKKIESENKKANAKARQGGRFRK